MHDDAPSAARRSSHASSRHGSTHRRPGEHASKRSHRDISEEDARRQRHHEHRERRKRRDAQRSPYDATSDLRESVITPSNPSPAQHDLQDPALNADALHLKRDDWMTLGNHAADDEASFFSALGQSQSTPASSVQAAQDAPQVHSRELNPMLNPARSVESSTRAEVSSSSSPSSYGAPGFKWRMMKLQRTYEIAEQSGQTVEQVALDRYGTMDAFDDARRERQHLHDTGQLPAEKSATFDASNAPKSSSQFRRPTTHADSRSETPSRSTAASVSQKIPKVLPRSVAQPTGSQKTQPLSLTELNRLEAKALRAEMMQKPDAPSLRAELEQAKQRHAGSISTSPKVETLPVIDGYGHMYDLGTSSSATMEDAKPRSKRRREGNDDAEDASLSELVHEEKIGAGQPTATSMDAAFAQQIATDHGYENDLDYVDDEAQRFARKKMRDDAMKRQFALQDFARTKRALDECPFCWQDEGRMPPRANIVSNGTCVYLALPDREPLVDGHCWIVPMQHHVSSLDVDEDGWTEIRNFMKCLIRMAASRGQTMVFFETVLSIRQQKHTYIEAVPIPNDVFAELPAYFKTALSEVESEWADHTQILYFSEQRPFQRSMVSKLPYFMIQWDYKGQRGYGHVIESRDNQHGYKPAGPNQEEQSFTDGDHVGGAGFPELFAQEILASLLDLDPYRWRRPKHIAGLQGVLDHFRATWTPYDWTRELAST
ncbi:Pre-mRNA-splicing factor cwf19 [Malassezia yamatoensis]|uniref:Pre-mRNA-splicing factor cwf19 n=1 Tax=Malassezia yamatoensis TaxID=253288 RepID=A0AAJ5YS10_9BASI|nr:Pre-mRNA-splicing factor cwf19 [Malassezia yamatoensis]